MLETKLDEHCKSNEHQLTKIEVKLDNIDSKMDRRANHVDRILDIKANKGDVAPKWVEWAVKALILAALTGSVGFVIWFIQDIISRR